MSFNWVPPGIFACACAALFASLLHRWRLGRKGGEQQARHVEAERIISMLSARQPGVWDQDELRDRVAAIALDLWSLPTLAALERLQTWVNPVLLTRVQQNWPQRCERRQLDVHFVAPVSFIQVNEGGPGPDRLIARVTAKWDGAWLDGTGRIVKKERRAPHETFHTWVHIDGQGWQLEQVASEVPTNEPPPSSVSCRILPATESEENTTY